MLKGGEFKTDHDSTLLIIVVSFFPVMACCLGRFEVILTSFGCDVN